MTKFPRVVDSNAVPRASENSFIKVKILISWERHLSSVNYKVFIRHKTEALHVYKVSVGVIKFISKFPH